MVVVITALAMYFAIYSSTTLVGLLLFAYSGIAQFFPGVVLGLFWKRVTALGVFAGLVVGVGCDMFLIFTKHDPFHGLNAGFIALCLNLIVTTSLAPRLLQSQTDSKNRSRQRSLLKPSCRNLCDKSLLRTRLQSCVRMTVNPKVGHFRNSWG